MKVKQLHIFYDTRNNIHYCNIVGKMLNIILTYIYTSDLF